MSGFGCDGLNYREVLDGRRRDVSFRLLAVAFTAALVAVGIATGATATTTAVPKLRGTIGPGYTISLKNAQGKKVKSLKRGKYTFIVRDKANIHNFTLKGPGAGTR
jgi:hypothetical protein